MTAGGRVADYGSVAAGYDRRYAIHEYAGVRGTLLGFVGEAGALLEVGCGRGRWLPVLAGFAWTESFEADCIEATMPAGEALATGVVDRAYTSQLTVLSDEEFERGAARIREADAAAGGELRLATDFRLYAAVGWLA